MAELGLKKMEIDAIEFAFDVYDFKGYGMVAYNLNPTIKTINETEKGKKILINSDVYPKYKACKDSKDQGGFPVEMMKLYDKKHDSTIIGNELFKLLTNCGEKLSKEEAKSLMKELFEPEDEDGLMPFIPFLERMCAAEL
eukprot:GFUD01092002.1.p1 GENE.GFUD01092002.1~~GFUD01092002.1.p1  ORF type:complete len:140 (-),score=49.93 GFUD01092002.1:26-445(-)